jgi:hypothetical protein
VNAAEPGGNGQSNLDAILERIAPEKRAEFLRSRLRIKQFQENDEILAVASYLDTIVVLVDGLTKNLSPAPPAGQDNRNARTEISQLTEVVNDLQARFKGITETTELLARLSKNRIIWGLVIAFVAGAGTVLLSGDGDRVDPHDAEYVIHLKCSRKTSLMSDALSTKNERANLHQLPSRR